MVHVPMTELGLICTKTVLDSGVLFVNFLLMLTVGMELQPHQLVAVTKRKGTALALFVSQVIVLPLLGLLIVWLLKLPPPITAGILLLAACPVGDIANFYTLLGRGNVALSVMMNAATCLMSMLTMALVFPVYSHFLGDRFVYAVPTPALVTRLLLMVALPVLAGMLIRRHAPGWSERRAALLKNASLVGVAFLVVYVIVTQWQLLTANWGVTVLSSGMFMSMALLIGMSAGRLLRLSAADVLTCGILFSVRNVSLALAIAVTLLHRVEYAAFAVVYFLTEVPLLPALVVTSRYWAGIRGWERHGCPRP